MTIPDDILTSTLRVLPDGVHGRVLASIQFSHHSLSGRQVKNFILTHGTDSRLHVFVCERFFGKQLAPDPADLWGLTMELKRAFHGRMSIKDFNKSASETITAFFDTTLLKYLNEVPGHYSFDFCEVENESVVDREFRNLIQDLLHSVDAIEEPVNFVSFSKLIDRQGGGTPLPVKVGQPRLSKEEWLKQHYPDLIKLPTWRFPSNG
jgi:hypothetical protein